MNKIMTLMLTLEPIALQAAKILNVESSTVLISLLHLATDTNINEVTKYTVHWKVWSGWKGNHDQRIEDSECSNCGYKHSTVYKSLDKLSSICPSCKSAMSVVEY